MGKAMSQIAYYKDDFGYEASIDNKVVWYEMTLYRRDGSALLQKYYSTERAARMDMDRYSTNKSWKKTN